MMIAMELGFDILIEWLKERLYGEYSYADLSMIIFSGARPRLTYTLLRSEGVLHIYNIVGDNTVVNTSEGRFQAYRVRRNGHLTSLDATDRMQLDFYDSELFEKFAVFVNV